MRVIGWSDELLWRGDVMARDENHQADLFFAILCVFAPLRFIFC